MTETIRNLNSVIRGLQRKLFRFRSDGVKIDEIHRAEEMLATTRTCRDQLLDQADRDRAGDVADWCDAQGVGIEVISSTDGIGAGRYFGLFERALNKAN